ncbi:MAG: hypothetical protein NTX50_06075 [Candidatus Sumerlaeota bacterium]|nr:hypothetical protein [Candidatus Sumerlaeota bacterium]
MAEKHTISKTREQLREEALRPCALLGYDYDRIAQYLISRQAYAVAEDALRHAIWLNPYEALFKEHLALCLLEQKQYGEALALAAEAAKNGPNRKSAEVLVQIIKRHLKSIASG